jgi:hypothetical protein
MYYWYSRCWIRISIETYAVPDPDPFLKAEDQVYLLNSDNFHAAGSVRIQESQINADPCGSPSETQTANFK